MTGTPNRTPSRREILVLPMKGSIRLTRLHGDAVAEFQRLVSSRPGARGKFSNPIDWEVCQARQDRAKPDQKPNPALFVRALHSPTYSTFLEDSSSVLFIRYQWRRYFRFSLVQVRWPIRASGLSQYQPALPSPNDQSCNSSRALPLRQNSLCRYRLLYVPVPKSLDALRSKI